MNTANSVSYEVFWDLTSANAALLAAAIEKRRRFIRAGRRAVGRVWGWLIQMGLGLILAFFLAGCASLSSYQAEQARWQAKADLATDAAGVGRVQVVLKGHSTRGRYVRWNQTVELGVSNSEGGKTWLLAHELSHHLLGHTEAWLDQEMDANARAVQVLALWGYPESATVPYIKQGLLNLYRRGSAMMTPGHDWCVEYLDITRRYPGYPDLRKPGECGA